MVLSNTSHLEVMSTLHDANAYTDNHCILILTIGVNCVYVCAKWVHICAERSEVDIRSLSAVAHLVFSDKSFQ